MVEIYASHRWCMNHIWKLQDGKTFIHSHDEISKVIFYHFNRHFNKGRLVDGFIDNLNFFKISHSQVNFLEK